MTLEQSLERTAAGLPHGSVWMLAVSTVGGAVATAGIAQNECDQWLLRASHQLVECEVIAGLELEHHSTSRS